MDWNQKSKNKLQHLVEGYRQAANCTKRSLPRGWREYAAVGASMGLVSSAEAQIVHVVPESPIQFTVPSTSEVLMDPDGVANTNTLIDLNADGVNDILAGVGIIESTTTFIFFGDTGQIIRRGINLGVVGDPADRPILNAAFVAVDESQFGYEFPTSAAPPLPLAQGDLIGPDNFLGTSTFATPFQTSLAVAGDVETFPDGDLTDQDLLFGFAVNGGSGDQFGWIRLALEAGEDGRLAAAEVVEWAFQTVAGVPIVAGDTGVVAPPAIDGDFNGDGQVDADDFQAFLTEFNGDDTVTPGPELNGNGNDDNLVNAADFNVFRDNLPSSASAAAAAVSVPEPTTFSLGALALGAAGVTSLRRRRQA